MKIQQLPITVLKSYANNPRTNDNAVDAVAKSITEFGFKVPIIIDSDNVIIAGHTRLKAAIKLGLKTVPVIIASDLTPDQVKAFRLADNKTGELAEWDLMRMDIEIDDIEMDMKGFGFEAQEEKVINDFDGIIESIDISEAIELPEYITIRTTQANKDKIVQLIKTTITGYCHVETS